MRSRLDLLRSKRTKLANENQVKYFKGHRNAYFIEGEKVFVRNDKNPIKPSWSPATVNKVFGNRIILCNPENTDSSVVWKRHTDQIFKSTDTGLRDQPEELSNDKHDVSISKQLSKSLNVSKLNGMKEYNMVP